MHQINDQRRQVMSRVSFQSPKYSPNLKFHQEVGCLTFSKHENLCRKDVTTSSKIVEKFNTKFPRNTDPDKVIKPAAKRVSDDSSSDHILSRHVHYPSISNTTINSTISPALINNSVLLMPNFAAPPLTSNGYNDLY